MENILKLEELIGKKLDTWTLEDFTMILEKYQDLLTPQTLFALLKENKNQEINILIKAVLTNINLDLAHKKIIEIVENKKSDEYDKFLNSKSYIERALCWCNILKTDGNFKIEDFSEKI
jgi:hypothetical protein